MNALITTDVGTRFGNWFDALWNDFDREFDLIFKNNGRKPSKMGYPKVDVSETDDGIVIEASVPGMTKDNVKVEYEDGMLAIVGKSEKRKENVKYHYKELHRSKFTRAFSIPDAVFDVENIDASLENGLLTITIPKKEKKKIQKTKTITIH